MRSRRPACHADVANGRSHGNPGAWLHAHREIAHVAVAADHAVPVPDVDHVAVTTVASGENDDAVADGADRSPFSRRVVSAGVVAPLAEDRMLARAEDAADATKYQWSAKEGSTQGHAAGVVVLPGAGTRRIEVNRLERAVAVGQSEPSAEDLVDDDRAVWLLKPFNEDLELVALHQAPPHVDLVLQNIAQTPRQLAP